MYSGSHAITSLLRAPGTAVGRIRGDLQMNRRVGSWIRDQGLYGAIRALPPTVEDLAAGVANSQRAPAAEVKRFDGSDYHAASVEAKSLVQRFERALLGAPKQSQKPRPIAAAPRATSACSSAVK